jgi:epoxyqueuosine reductase QueG
MGGHENLLHLRESFEAESERHGLKGVMGVAAFDSVLNALLPIQRRRLRELCGDRLRALLGEGSIVCAAYAYPEQAILSIAQKVDGGYNKASWNLYAREYHRLNRALNATVQRLAAETGGMAMPATLDGVAAKIGHVEEYYGMVVSHRVVAEQAGVGWRGKNELIVNSVYSCAIRLASVITDLPIDRTGPSVGGCGGCRSCLDACTFLRFKDRLANYREQCRRYITSLGLEGDVCGKCVKACYRRSVYADRFRL